MDMLRCIFRRQPLLWLKYLDFQGSQKEKLHMME